MKILRLHERGCVLCYVYVIMFDMAIRKHCIPEAEFSADRNTPSVFHAIVIAISSRTHITILYYLIVIYIRLCPDMLEVGCDHGPGGENDPGLSYVEARTHFGAWCIVSSPLILSHDTNNDTITDEIWPIISNTEAIAINQAWAGDSG